MITINFYVGDENVASLFTSSQVPRNSDWVVIKEQRYVVVNVTWFIVQGGMYVKVNLGAR